MKPNPQLKASARAGTRADAANERQPKQRHYTKFLDEPHILEQKEQAALVWLKRDFQLLPAQPNTKRLVSGFGYYQDRIRTSEGVYEWFGKNRFSNLAVCATQTSLILDFDDADLYKFWAGKFPDAARTYTERTPRGGYHVFGYIWGNHALRGYVPLEGVEFKRVVLVYPSTVNGRQYTQGAGDLLKLDADLILPPISQLQTITKAQRVDISNGDNLRKIKTAFSCLDLLRSADSTLKVYGSGKRFITVTCPFHDDKEPSFWIDTERNLWGCHACGVRGDVINLYARLNGLTVPEAIREMRKSL